MSFVDFFRLIRINQWYKNLVIFLPLIFVGHFFNMFEFVGILLGFFSLCFMSSVNYIINDFIDRKKDKLNPEKKNKPLVTGAVSDYQAFIVLIVFAAASIFLASILSSMFLFSIIALFISSQLYSLFFKDELFLDILFIAINFVIRAVSGTFIIHVSISPWLVLCTFFLSLFLSVGKRKSESMLLGSNASMHRSVLKYYSADITNSMMIIATSLLIISYGLYSFLSNFKNLIWTLPVALYVIFRYTYLVYSGSDIARHPHNFVKDVRLVLGIVVWFILIFLIIYFS
ncbi:MAG: UbiA family prenyltransferase [Candidatus Nanoarchaeia archaeon]